MKPRLVDRAGRGPLRSQSQVWCNSWAMIEQCLDSSKLTFLGIVDREFLSAAYTEAAPSIPRFAPIQGIKSKKDLPGLAPKGCLISAEAVNRVIGHIG
jgi:hypothetical protein